VASDIFRQLLIDGGSSIVLVLVRIGLLDLIVHIVANFQSLVSLGVDGTRNWDVSMFVLVVACMSWKSTKEIVEGSQ
jgi:hypothetical protein